MVYPQTIRQLASTSRLKIYAVEPSQKLRQNAHVEKVWDFSRKTCQLVKIKIFKISTLKIWVCNKPSLKYIY